MDGPEERLVVRQEEMHREHQRKILMAVWASRLRGL